MIEAGGRLAGASDHLVSEALYLADPEGNGIEIYRDRPRDQWRRDGDELRMATLPLDLRDLIGELDADAPPGVLPVGTRIGHVHLSVSDLDAAERFYSGLRSFAVELPDVGAVERTVERLEADGVDVRRADGSVGVRDPSGNGIVLEARD